MTFPSPPSAHMNPPLPYSLLDFAHGHGHGHGGIITVYTQASLLFCPPLSRVFVLRFPTNFQVEGSRRLSPGLQFCFIGSPRRNSLLLVGSALLCFVLHSFKDGMVMIHCLDDGIVSLDYSVPTVYSGTTPKYFKSSPLHSVPSGSQSLCLLS